MGSHRSREVSFYLCSYGFQSRDGESSAGRGSGSKAAGGAENPTLTIVALAIRQADHIAREMAAGTL